MLVVPIPEREFNLYALSLPQGPNFDPFVVVSGWKCDNGQSVGCVLRNYDTGEFGIRVFRRRIDGCFAVTVSNGKFQSHDAALAKLSVAMRPGEPAEPIPPGAKKRKPLLETKGRSVNKTFKLLTRTLSHYPALMAVGEIYLAMPNPDDNFVSDFQTENFDSRLFELYLLAAFREQGVSVSQQEISPDFMIERSGHQCSVEAVTANPRNRGTEKPELPTHAPESRRERLLGAPAVRFAKTLRSKLQREYEKLPHVRGKPFALAIADFHAPSSMVWSREALPSYLYGIYPEVADGPEGKYAIGSAVETLLGADEIPAGLFRDPSISHLSGIVFSNAPTIAKFNRMGYLAGWQPPGLRMERSGIIFDRTPGVLKPKPFDLDIVSDEYANLWEGGEAWCQELEVYHNPLAANPIQFDLLPGATHWFEQDGEIICSTIWETSVLSSITHVSAERGRKRRTTDQE